MSTDTPTPTSVWQRNIPVRYAAFALAGTAALTLAAGWALTHGDGHEATGAPAVVEGRAVLGSALDDIGASQDEPAAPVRPTSDELIAAIPSSVATDLELGVVWDAVGAAQAAAAEEGQWLAVLVAWGPYVTDDPNGAGVATHREGAPQWTLVTPTGNEALGEDAAAARTRAAELAAEWGTAGRVVEVIVGG